MTIARDFIARPGASGHGAGPVQDEARREALVSGEFTVPVGVREERLDAQVRSFERAGYRLETRAGLQAIVVKPRERRPVRDAVIAVGTLGLALVPAAIGVRRVVHRVVITVDSAGAVRLA